MLADLVGKYSGPDSKLTLWSRLATAIKGAVQAILSDFYDVAPQRAQFLSPIIAYDSRSRRQGCKQPIFLSILRMWRADNRIEVEKFTDGAPTELDGTER